MLERIRHSPLVAPPERWRLWLGVAIAVIGPVISAALIRFGPLGSRPGVAFLLAVVFATVFGRLVAAAIAIPLSLVLLERFARPEFSASVRSEQDVWAVLAFALVSCTVVLLVTRRDAASDAADAERRRFQLLARAGDSLSESLDIDETLRRLGDVLVPRLADWFSVDLLEDGGIRNAVVIHPDPVKVELARDLQRRFPADPDARSGAPNVIRTGRSELTESIPDELLVASIEDPDLLETMRGLGLRCAMTVPLTARGKTVGALTLIGAESHERYGPDDLQLAEEIADRAALAIDTARMFRAESDARAEAMEEARRNEILKDVTAAFGRSKTVDQVIAAMLDEGLPAAGASAGTVGLVEREHRVVMRGLSGYEPNDRSYWHEFDVSDALPMSEAIAENRVVVTATRDERSRRYPAIADEGDPRDHVLVCIPLDLGGHVLGAFSASYPPGSVFADEDLSLLRSIGEQCAQAIDRARARDQAQRAEERLVALAAASQALARSLAFDDTVATIIRLAKTHLGADAALIEIDEHGPTVLGGERSPLPAGLQLEDVVALDVPRLVGERLVRLPDDEQSSDPTIVLPLVIAGSLAGLLVVGRLFLNLDDDDDSVFAVEVARRMARALENARLYRDRDHVARTLQVALLPPRLPEVPGVEIAALFRPAERGHEIGGDFYDVFEIDDGRWAAVVGDVCGKGIEAATLTGMVRHTLRSVAVGVARPSDALGALNRALLREELDGRFCTVALAIVEPAAGGSVTATVSLGGHPLPQLLSAEGAIERVGEHGTLLGVTPNVRLSDTTVTLPPGAAFIVFTDGLIAKDEVTGEEPAPLLRALAGRSWPSAVAVRDRIDAFVEEAEGELHDDIAVLVLRTTDLSLS